MATGGTSTVGVRASALDRSGCTSNTSPRPASENPQEASAAGDQPESTVTGQDAVPCPAQDAQAGAVDEGHGTQVEHQVRVRARGQGVETCCQRYRCHEVDLAAQLDDRRPVDGVYRLGRCEPRVVLVHSLIKEPPVIVRKGRTVPAGWVCRARGNPHAATVRTRPRPVLQGARPAHAVRPHAGQAGLAGHIRRRSAPGS